MIDDDKKGKWLVPLEAQSGGCSLVSAPQQHNKGGQRFGTGGRTVQLFTINLNSWSKCSPGRKMAHKQQEVDITSIKVSFLGMN